MKGITKEQLLAQLKEFARSADTEGAHSDADSALLRFINDPEVSKAYDAIEKWYA